MPTQTKQEDLVKEHEYMLKILEEHKKVLTFCKENDFNATYRLIKNHIDDELPYLEDLELKIKNYAQTTT